MTDQLDMFACAPPVAPAQITPPDLKLLPVQCCCHLTAAEAALDEAIGDLIAGYPMVDASGAHYLVDPLAAEALRILRSSPSAVAKKDLHYSVVEALRRAGVATCRYDGNRIRVRLNNKLILELGAESRRRALAYAA